MSNLLEQLCQALIYRRELLKHFAARRIRLTMTVAGLIDAPQYLPAKNGRLLWVMEDHATQIEMTERYKAHVARQVLEDASHDR